MRHTRAFAAGSLKFSAIAQWQGKPRLVAIGSSAGGIDVLSRIVSEFPADCPPTLVVQHLPERFMARVVERFNRNSAARVQEAEDGAILMPGEIRLAPADRHLELRASRTRWLCRLSDAPPINGFRPSIDVLFQSVAQVAGPKGVGVILTGIGRDGAEGLLKMRLAGARTIGQDKGSSPIYGIPKAAFELGAVERQYPADVLASEILSICKIQRSENS
jgi:two-component system, chemotaxis family, protein-glutamate methylesterase/glutaminase